MPVYLGCMALLSLLSGLFAYLFQISLLFVVKVFHSHSWFIFFLPVAALFIHWFYSRIKEKGISSPGKRVIHEINQLNPYLPSLLIPVTYAFTLLSHLFGASVGREGVAVQVGATFGENVGRWFNLSGNQKKVLMAGGVAAGFAALFGTPLTAVAFAHEFSRVKPSKQTTPGIVICAALSYGISYLLETPHTRFSSVSFPDLSPAVLWFDMGLGAALLFFSWFFIYSQVLYAKAFSKLPSWVGRLAASLLLTFSLTYVGTHGFATLGLPFMAEAFLQQPLQHGMGDAFIKLVLIVLSLQAGFKGGEVTPLFASGALLGAAMAVTFDLAPEFGAALGLSLLFPSLAKAPVAGIVLGIELFGVESLVHLIPMLCLLQSLGPQKGLYR